MNSLLPYIMMVLLAAVLVKQVSYLMKLKIMTKKSIGDMITVVLGIIILSCITIYFGKSIRDYGLAVIGIAAFIVLWLKQGIAEEGVILNERGKELHLWSEVRCARVNKNQTIYIEYLNQAGARIVKQQYNLKDYEKIIDLFNRNGVTFAEN